MLTVWSRAILNQFNLPNEDLLCVTARARVREQVRASVSRDEIRDVRERGALDATARPVHTRGTRGLWVVQRVDDLENLILELSHGVIGSIPRHSVFVKVNFNDFRVGHVERIRFPTQRFDDILVILVREAMLLVQLIDEGEHAVPINVRAHHVRGFAAARNGARVAHGDRVGPVASTGRVLYGKMAGKKGDYVDTSGRDGTTTMTMTRAATEATTEATTTPDDCEAKKVVADAAEVDTKMDAEANAYDDDARGAGGKMRKDGAARARTGARMTPYARQRPVMTSRVGNPAVNADTKVYVGNLPYGCSWQDLKDHFSNAMGGECVRFADILTSRDGRSKGCGIVTFNSSEDAKKAIETMHDTEIGERKIFVREDREGERGNDLRNRIGPSATSPDASVYVGNLPWSTRWQELKDIFRKVGDVAHADVTMGFDGRSRGWGVVTFMDPQCAQVAIERLNGTMLNDRALIVRRDERARS